jgi:hypothetical protein
MDDATKDVTRMLGDRERHDEKFPLFVFVAVGAVQVEQLEAVQRLAGGADRLLVDDVVADPDVDEAVDVSVTPSAADAPATTATTRPWPAGGAPAARASGWARTRPTPSASPPQPRSSASTSRSQPHQTTTATESSQTSSDTIADGHHRRLGDPRTDGAESVRWG